MATDDTALPSPPVDSAPDSVPAAPPSDKPKPSVFLSDEQIDDAGLGDCQVGDTYTATVTFKVASVSESDGHRDKTLEIQSIADTKPAGAEGEAPDEGATPTDETPTEEDILGYKRPEPKPGAPVDLGKLRSE